MPRSSWFLFMFLKSHLGLRIFWDLWISGFIVFTRLRKISVSVLTNTFRFPLLLSGIPLTNVLGHLTLSNVSLIICCFYFNSLSLCFIVNRFFFFWLYFQVHGSFFCHVWYAINFIEYKYLFMYLVALGLSCSKQDLVPWPGMEPRHAALGAWNLSYWTTREIPSLNIFFISGIIVFIFISLGFSYLTCLYLAFWTCGIQFLITVLMSYLQILISRSVLVQFHLFFSSIWWLWFYFQQGIFMPAVRIRCLPVWVLPFQVIYLCYYKHS